MIRGRLCFSRVVCRVSSSSSNGSAYRPISQIPGNAAGIGRSLTVPLAVPEIPPPPVLPQIEPPEVVAVVVAPEPPTVNPTTLFPLFS